MSTPIYDLMQPGGQRLVGYRCDTCDRLRVDEYTADTCCGGKPSQRALEARGQQRMEGL